MNDVYVTDQSFQRRENKYPVILANTPSEPNAMAIDEDANDFSYFSIMRFGASQTPMYMLIDTGSANTWVFDSNCPSSSCKEHNSFGSVDSSTLQVTATPFSLAYGTGQVTGIVGSDTVSFANYTTDLGFGLATTASSDFSFYPMDGILGLGPTSSNSLGVPTVMEHLDSADLLPHGNIVGIHLQRQTDNTNDGQITFGSIDTSRYTGNLNYISVSSGSDMWEIPVTDALVDNSACSFTGRSVVIDTGTSYILLPFQDALTLHDLIPGTAHAGEDFTIPCDATAEVQFTFGGVTYSVGPQDYLGKPSGSDASLCNSNIIGHQAFGPDQWILGDVFLKNVYAVFDFDRSRIGTSCLLLLSPVTHDLCCHHSASSSLTYSAPLGFGTQSSSSTASTSSVSSSPTPTLLSSAKQTSTVYGDTTLITRTASATTHTLVPTQSSTTSSSIPNSSTNVIAPAPAPTTTPNSSPFGDSSPNAGSRINGNDVLRRCALIAGAFAVGLLL